MPKRSPESQLLRLLHGRIALRSENIPSESRQSFLALPGNTSEAPLPQGILSRGSGVGRSSKHLDFQFVFKGANQKNIIKSEKKVLEGA